VITATQTGRNYRVIVEPDDDYTYYRCDSNVSGLFFIREVAGIGEMFMARKGWEG